MTDDRATRSDESAAVMDTLYWRKVAQIAHRDGGPTIKSLAAPYARHGDRSPIKRTVRRRLRAWFREWLDSPEPPRG
jgi:hypothetical protein